MAVSAAYQPLYNKLSPESKKFVDSWGAAALAKGARTTNLGDEFVWVGQALDTKPTLETKIAYLNTLGSQANWKGAYQSASADYLKTLNPKVSGYTPAELNAIAENTSGNKLTDYLKSVDAASKPNAPTDVYTPTKYSENVQKLTNQYGGLLNSKGKPVLSQTYIDQVASGAVSSTDFKAKLDPYIDQVMGYTVDSVTNNLDHTDPKYVAARKAIIDNPTQFVNDYNTNVSKLTQNAQGTWDTATPSTTGTGLTNFIDPQGNFIYNGGKNQLGGAETDPASMAAMIDAYDPNAGTWQAPTRKYLGTKDGKHVYSDNQSVSSATPFGDLLNEALANHKDPYAADYVNSLKAPATPDLTAIKKTADVNTTPADLLKLANTAGQTYDPKAVTSLSPALTQMYQPVTNTKADGTQYTAKPGAPDLTKTTIPTLTSDGTGIINSNGTVTKIDNTNTTPKDWWYTRGFASEAQANANGWFNDVKKVSDDPGKVVDPGIVKPLVKTPAELAAEKFALDKASYMNSFTARDYIDPQNRTRSDILTQAKTDPKLAANLDWSAQLDQSPADFKSKVGMTSAEIAANKTQSATTPAPFTVTPQTSYSPADYSPELKAALAARASTDAQNALVGDTITANEKARGIISPNVSNTVSTGNMNTYATGPNGEAGIPSALTTAPQYTAGDYIPPANRAVPTFANNPALADQIAWSATQDAAQAKQAAPAVGINTLPNSTGATGTTTPAPFTVNSTTSYSPSDYSPELKAALAARAASMGK